MVFLRHAHNAPVKLPNGITRNGFLPREKEERRDGNETLKDTFQPSHPNHEHADEQCRQSRVVIVHESNRRYDEN